MSLAVQSSSNLQANWEARNGNSGSSSVTSSRTHGRPNESLSIWGHSVLERSERPSGLASSLRLETAVRFTGVFTSENEDLAGAAAYWRSRQEHVEATDFYKHMGNPAHETVAAETSPLSRTESLASDASDRTIESASVTTPQSVTETAAARLFSRKPTPPRPPPRRPNSSVYVQLPGLSGDTLEIPGLSSKPVELVHRPHASPPVLPPKLKQEAGVPAVNPFRDSVTTSLPFADSRPTIPPKILTSSEAHSTQNEPKTQSSVRQDAVPDISNLTIKSVDENGPKLKTVQWASYEDPDLLSQPKPAPRHRPRGRKPSNTTPANLLPPDEVKSGNVVPTTPVVPNVAKPRPPLPPRTSAPIHLKEDFTPARLELRDIMSEMRRQGIGSRKSMQIGLEYVMKFWSSIPSRSSSAAVTESHLKEMMNNFNKRDGKGLAEMSQGFSMMHICVRLGKLDLAQELISQGANLKEVPEKTQTLMRNAIWYSDNIKMVEFLIQHGDELNARHHRDSVSPLHHAVAAHNFEAVKVLLEAGADVTVTVRKFRKDIGAICRPKDRTRPERMLGILYLLLDAGSPVQKSADGGYTAALFTGASGIDSVLDLLADKGADPVEIQKLRDFSLSSAIIYNDVAKVQEHINAGTDLNSRNIFRWRPLDLAQVHKKEKIEKLLAAAGAKPASAKKFKEAKGSTTADSKSDSDNWSMDAQGEAAEYEDDDLDT